MTCITTTWINQPEPVLSPDKNAFLAQEHTRVWKVIYGCNSTHWEKARSSFQSLSDACRTWIGQQIQSAPVEYISWRIQPGKGSPVWKAVSFFNLNDLDLTARELAKRIIKGLGKNGENPPNLGLDWIEQCNFATKNHILSTVDRWVESAPEDENRSHVREKIFHFINGNPIKLDFSNLGLTSLPEVNIEGPNHLNLSGNQLTSLPDWFGSLRRLASLSLDSNPLDSLPQNLFFLPNLISLSFSCPPDNKPIRLSKDDLLWATYYLLYEQPQASKNIPLQVILEMMNHPKPQAPKIQDFRPTEASSIKSSTRWNCLGEATTPDGQELLLFKFIDKGKNPFPAEEPTSKLIARVTFEDDTLFKYHFRSLGFWFLRDDKTDDCYIILPTVKSFLSGWQNLRERCAKHLTLPPLSVFVSPKAFSDQEFVHYYLLYDQIISENEQFLHDMWSHLMEQLSKIFEAAQKPQPVFSVEQQRLKNLIQRKRDQIDFVFNKLGLCNSPEKKELLVKYQRPIRTLLGVAVDVITSVSRTSFFNWDCLATMSFLQRATWGKYFLERYSNPDHRDEHVQDFTFDELLQAWKALTEINREQI